MPKQLNELDPVTKPPPAVVSFPPPTQPTPAAMTPAPAKPAAPAATPAPAAPPVVQFQSPAPAGTAAKTSVTGAAPAALNNPGQPVFVGPASQGMGSSTTPGGGNSIAGVAQGTPSQYTGPDVPFQQFAAEDPSVGKPSDFVGFSQFAGLNAGELKDIADRASTSSNSARTDAAKYLQAAEGEATADTPVEKTADYSKYLDAMKSASSLSDSAVAPTGNPQEDALRGIYAPAQGAREDRLASDSATLAGLSASQRNTYLATQQKLAADKAERARQAALQPERDAKKSAIADMNTQRQEAGFAPIDHTGKAKGGTTTAKRTAGKRTGDV